MAKDYIPRPNGEFNSFQKNLVNTVVNKAVAWNLPGGDVSDLVADSDTYGDHYKVISKKASCSTSQRAAHDAFRDAFEKKLRGFVNTFLRNNKSIAVDDRTNMKIPVRSKKRKHRAAIDGMPVLVIESIPGAFIKFICRRENHEGKPSIHPESDGLELRYSIGTPIFDFTKMPHSIVIKKARLRLTVIPEWRGQKIYVCARWINLVDHSRSGAWCNVVVSMIY